MSDVKDFLNLIYRTDEEERSKAYEQASDIIETLKSEGGREYDTEDFIHFCIFSTCLLDLKIAKLLALILEVTKK